MRVAVLGLGEAGGRLAADLVAAGASVVGWDPAPPPLPTGARLAASNADAAAGADLVLSVNLAAVAAEVAREVAPVLGGAPYADLNTAAPALKRELAAVIAAAGAPFADVAVMARIVPRGVRTPMLASGAGAAAVAALLAPFGGAVTVLDGAEAEAGGAAARKLLRSIAYKGVAAVVDECLEVARAMGLERYAREQLATLGIDGALVDAMGDGSRRHARRRASEMDAAAALAESVAVAPLMSASAAARLRGRAGADAE